MDDRRGDEEGLHCGCGRRMDTRDTYSPAAGRLTPERAPGRCNPRLLNGNPRPLNGSHCRGGRIRWASWWRSGVRSCSPRITCSPCTSNVYTNRSGCGGVGATDRRSIRLSSDSTSGVRGSSPRVSSPLCRTPANPPERVTVTTPSAPAPEVGAEPPEDDADGVTPTDVHACVRALSAPAETSRAASTVAAANPAKSVSAPIPEVRAAYQILPAPSHEFPPTPVAAR